MPAVLRDRGCNVTDGQVFFATKLKDSPVLGVDDLLSNLQRGLDLLKPDPKARFDSPPFSWTEFARVRYGEGHWDGLSAGCADLSHQGSVVGGKHLDSSLGRCR